MKIKVTVEIEAPDGAAYYAGDLLDSPDWWKPLTRSDGEYWCCWSYERKAWLCATNEKPYWIHAIAEVK